MKQTAKLYRIISGTEETQGVMYCFLERRVVRVFYTLELPALENLRNISCIPEGVYNCIYSYSPSLSVKHGTNVFCYEITNVPNRAGIRFDVANFVKELRGCIGLGLSFADLNKDGVFDIANSRAAIAQLTAIFKREPFTLIIKNLDAPLP